MITPKQLQANRRNALKSTGPKTPEGKAKVSRNATKHGLLSKLRVLPGLESQEQWNQHWERTLADLRPVGYLEQMLAERIALLLWRLGRVARYERDTASAAMENVEVDFARGELQWRGSERCLREGPLDDVRKRLENARQGLPFLERLPNLPGEEPADCGGYIVHQAFRAAHVEEYLTPGELVPGRDDLDMLEFEEISWTVDMVRQAGTAIANEAKIDWDELRRRMIAQARQELDRTQREHDLLAGKLAQYRRSRAVAGKEGLEKLTRYETHLERSLYKALHELQRLQAARRDGGSVPAPIAVDLDVTGVAGTMSDGSTNTFVA